MVAYRPEKNNHYQTWLMVDEDRVNFPGNCETTVDFLTAKILLNSMVSTPEAKFMTIDIKDLCLNTPMYHYKYMQL